MYSKLRDAAEKLHGEFGVPILESYDEAVGKVEGVIITARHGKHHYEYAKPYIESGIPMFIDKPITVDPAEAVEFMRLLKARGVKICGGSSLGHADEIIALRENAKDGVTVGGIVRAPLKSNNENGGFWFYAPHLVEMVSSIFGKYPRSVKTFSVGDEKTVIFRYDNYDITGIYVEDGYNYYAARFTKNSTESYIVAPLDNWTEREFAEFDSLMRGGEQRISYKDFISSVFVMSAIEKALVSGGEVKLEEYEI